MSLLYLDHLLRILSLKRVSALRVALVLAWQRTIETQVERYFYEGKESQVAGCSGGAA